VSVVVSKPAPLAKSGGPGLGGSKSPSPHGAKGKEVTETDENGLGHLFVPAVSDTSASLAFREAIGSLNDLSTTGDQGKNFMEIDNVNANRCVGQPVPAHIPMSSPRGQVGSPGGCRSHEGELPGTKSVSPRLTDTASVPQPQPL